jgi:hypothetical protein
MSTSTTDWQTDKPVAFDWLPPATIQSKGGYPHERSRPFGQATASYGMALAVASGLDLVHRKRRRQKSFDPTANDG